MLANVDCSTRAPLPAVLFHRQEPEAEDERERVFLVGAAIKGEQKKYTYDVHESVEELGRLAETAGLKVRCKGGTWGFQWMGSRGDGQSAWISAVNRDNWYAASQCVLSFLSTSSATFSPIRYPRSLRLLMPATVLHPPARGVRQNPTTRHPSRAPTTQVMGSTFQMLEAPNMSTYIGSGKVRMGGGSRGSNWRWAGRNLGEVQSGLADDTAAGVSQQGLHCRCYVVRLRCRLCSTVHTGSCACAGVYLCACTPQVAEVARAVAALDVETVIFDDELSP